jgi:uncharacterized membrane protein
VTLLACVLGITSPTRSANAFSFTTVDVPGAPPGATGALGINGAGQIVGDFFDAAGKRTNGFLRAATGTFTTIHVPGAITTSAHGINDAGQIAGYFYAAPHERHGFVTTR